jgi:hypothetical protein
LGLVERFELGAVELQKPRHRDPGQFGADLISLRHPLDIVHVDGIVVERLVALDIGPELMVGAAPQRDIAIEEFVNVGKGRQEVPRAERIRVSALIAGPIAGAEKGRLLHERHIPSAHQHQLMGGADPRKTSADNQRIFHVASIATEPESQGAP